MANEYAYTKDPDKNPTGPSALARKNKNTNREIGAEENRNKKIEKKEKKTLGKKQYENFKTALDTKFDKMSRIQKTYEGASPKIKKDLENKFKDSFKSKNTVASTRRETGRTEVAKGGRINFKGGGCAKRGVKKNAYGKNS